MASPVANAVVSCTRTVFGSSVIALCLLMASGCALPHRLADRNFSRNRQPTKSSIEPTDGISFKSPRTSGRTDSEQAVEHQDEQTGTASTGSLHGEIGLAPGYSQITQVDWESDDPTSKRVVHALAETELDRREYGQVQPAGTQIGRQASKPLNGATGTPAGEKSASTSNPGSIKLQGLEFDDAPTSPSNNSSIPNWNDRPSAVKRETNNSKRDVGQAPAELPTSSPTAPDATASAVPKAAAQLAPLPWQSELEQLIVRAEQSLAQTKPGNTAAEQQEYLRKQAQLRLLYLMAQRQEDALMAIPGVEQMQQEFWQQMIWAMSNSFDTVQFPELSDRATHAVTPLSAALRHIREEANLSIKNMTFCRKVSYFGNYERFPRNEFTPGYEVLLYTEIENFVSTPTVDGEYRTSLKSLIEITDSKGKVVWTKGFPPTEDFCRNPRRDYFHNYQFHIPEDLPTGTYSLKLTIVDELSHKRVSNSLNFVLK